MSDMDFGTAEELLAAAIEQDNQPATPVANSSETQANEPTEPVVETTQADEPFTNIDPNALPDDLKQIYKSMQGDFTRKTQEIAEWRKLGQAYEGMTPEQAQQALEFTHRLQTDPQFAQEVYQGLGQALNTELDQGPTEPDYDEQEWDDPRDKVIDELLEWKNQQMEQQAYNERLNELMRQEQTIRQQHPEYTDDDLESIAALAHSYEADLIKATDAYEALRQRLISGYASTKAQVPRGEPASTQTGQLPPEPAKTLDEAYKMAMEHIANLDQ